jgi:hypothetical protein
MKIQVENIQFCALPTIMQNKFLMMCKNRMLDEKLVAGLTIDDEGVNVEIIWELLDADFQNFLVHSFADAYKYDHETCQDFIKQIKKGIVHQSILKLKNMKNKSLKKA